MADLILDGAKLEAITAAISVSKAYADEEMSEGHLNAEQYAVFVEWRKQLDELGDFFAGLEHMPGERVH